MLINVNYTVKLSHWRIKLYTSPLAFVKIKLLLLELIVQFSDKINVQSKLAVHIQPFSKEIEFPEMVYVPLQIAGYKSWSLCPVNWPFEKVSSTWAKTPFRSKVPMYVPLITVLVDLSQLMAKKITQQKSNNLMWQMNFYDESYGFFSDWRAYS